MGVYLDSSALVKLVVAEPESGALRRFLGRRPQRVSSALARVEVLRAVRLQGRPAAERAKKLLERIRLLRLDDVLLEAAAAIDPRVLRSLDAIHLASAQALGDDLDAVVTYDRRMSDAASGLGLPVRSPGAAGDRLRRAARHGSGRFSA
ncbi:MAG: type II toxin-antitoxin system VapC family toxin [Deltaproteobacteria bacterium]|nr:type II toxin-antitoxin system VapC family toxin [Deltaproteobacteria bacterium]